MLHYNPRRVSSINMPIFKRTNCIFTASGTITLCTVQYSMPDESRLQSRNLSKLIDTKFYSRLKKLERFTTDQSLSMLRFWGKYEIEAIFFVDTKF